MSAQLASTPTLTIPPVPTIARRSAWILAVAYVSFFALGLPTGAFTVAWFGMESDLGLLLAHSGYIVGANTIMYSVASALLGQMSRRFTLQTINLIGTIILAIGFLGIALAPSIAIVVIASALCGIGLGMIDSSLNTYMTQHFGAREMNWMYAFWGGGASISPLIMTSIMTWFTWRIGYGILAVIVALVSLFVLVSIRRGAWRAAADLGAAQSQSISDDNAVTSLDNAASSAQLSQVKYRVLQILAAFLYGGMDYKLVFFTGVVLTFHGVAPEMVAIFPMVYYVAMTAGRLVFGWLAKWLNDNAIIRIGLALAFIGVLILLLTHNVAGMALAGLGMAPVFPSLLHETSNRFTPQVTAKLVGYEVAAFGAGMAVLFFAMSRILQTISLDALFPISLGFIAATFILNEILKAASSRQKQLPVP